MIDIHARSIKGQYACSFANNVSKFYKLVSLFKYMVN